MNGKEEKFFGALAEAGTLLAKAGEALLASADGKLAPGEAAETIRGARGSWRQAQPALAEKMQRAFAAAPEAEAARLLLAETDALLRRTEKFAAFLFAAEFEKEEEGRRLETLIAYALRELSRILSYSLSIRADYMKAEARAQKLLAFEERGEEDLAAGIRRAAGGDDAGRTAVILRLYELTSDILSGAAAGSADFQKLTESYI